MAWGRASRRCCERALGRGGADAENGGLGKKRLAIYQAVAQILQKLSENDVSLHGTSSLCAVIEHFVRSRVNKPCMDPLAPSTFFLLFNQPIRRDTAQNVSARSSDVRFHGQGGRIRSPALTASATARCT